MAKPNYGYEKRQKELAKKNKKADKLRSKSERKLGEPEEGEAGSESSEAVADPVPPADAPPQP